MAQKGDDTIRKASVRCLHLFARNIDNARSLNGPRTDEPTQSALQDEFVRLKLWASNISIFADVHSSLDFRLREIPDVAELFLRQLDTIEIRLEQGNYGSPWKFVIAETKFHGKINQAIQNTHIWQWESYFHGLKLDSLFTYIADIMCYSIADELAFGA